MSVRIDRVSFAAAMARLDINCKKLVELSGVSRVTVTAVKNGKSCSRETADKLAQVLGCGIIKEEVTTMPSIKRRIINLGKLLEQRQTEQGVALLILQPDGTWELSLSGKHQTYKTADEARHHIRPKQPLIIIDL